MNTILLRKHIVAALLCLSITCVAQKRTYTVANAHSHNDYVNALPFYTAYNTGFGSMEADIFSFRNHLLVGHDSADLVKNRSMETYYIKPLDSCIRANHGNVYSNSNKQLILLVDIKNAPAATLDSLIALLKRYPAITGCTTLRVTITGSRPDPEFFTRFPGFIWFDGVLSDTYSATALTRILLFSDNLRSYVNWKGDAQLLPADADKLRAAIKKGHGLGKPVRFWNAPDTPYAWEQLMGLDADYINTDHIVQLGQFWAVTPAIGSK